MQKILAIGVFLALTIPLGSTMAIPQATTYTNVLDAIEAHFGFVPETALVNGVEMPTFESLTLLRENAVPLTSTEGVPVPPSDVGFGVRRGPNPCNVTTILTAYTFSTGAPQQALVNEKPAQLPGGIIVCGGRDFAYKTGVGSADVAPGATFAFACVNTSVAGSWAVNPTSCIFPLPGGTESATVGRTGFLDILIRSFGLYFHIEQQFGGVKSEAPNNQDVATIVVS